MNKRPIDSAIQVFVNCPFDEAYQHIFHALVFTLHVCGFAARSALEVDNAAGTRFEKIVRMIRDCSLGIHDISRTELNIEGLPRFNMPLELGLFLGTAKFGSRAMRKKVAHVLDCDTHRYQKFISDIAGQDVRAHNGDPDGAIRAMRKWLVTIERTQHLPGGAAICELYHKFKQDLPGMLDEIQLKPEEIQFNDLKRLISEWVTATVSKSN